MSPIALVEQFLFETYLEQAFVLKWLVVLMNCYAVVTFMMYIQHTTRTKGLYTLGIFVVSLLVDVFAMMVFFFTTPIEVIVCHTIIMLIKIHNCLLINRIK